CIQNIEILFLGKEIHVLDTVLFLYPRLDDHVPFVIDDHIELLRRQPQQVPNLIGQGTEIPDVCYGYHQADVSHTLAAHFLFGHFHTATITRSEEHTSELQSREKLVCRLLLEKITTTYQPS